MAVSFCDKPVADIIFFSILLQRYQHWFIMRINTDSEQGYIALRKERRAFQHGKDMFSLIHLNLVQCLTLINIFKCVVMVHIQISRNLAVLYHVLRQLVLKFSFFLTHCTIAIHQTIISWEALKILRKTKFKTTEKEHFINVISSTQTLLPVRCKYLF